jgi:UDP-glucose 4-epimerase
MNRVLITGGAGFIGTHIIKKIGQEYEIFVIDNLSNEKSKDNADRLKDSHISFFREDVRDMEKICEVIKACKPASCIHLAAKISVPESVTDPYTTMNVNVTGTLNVLEACVQNSVKRFVFASSAAVYGHVGVLPITEDSDLKPISPYGASKVAAEEIIDAYANLNLFKSIITLRLFNIYGAGQSDEYAGVISKFKERISKGFPPVIFGDGNQQRDFISVEDVVEGIIKALEPPKGIKIGKFNIGTGIPTKIGDLARIMANIMGKPHLDAVYKEGVNGDIRLSCADISKTKNILKFNTRRDLITGLKQFIQS